ncbi:hypothetical protein OSTOST_15543, partial [Ostertagia ostertagi]
MYPRSPTQVKNHTRKRQQQRGPQKTNLWSSERKIVILLTQDICAPYTSPHLGFFVFHCLRYDLAVDRLMSLRKIYLLLAKKYRVAYTIAQITVVLVYISLVGAWTLIRSTAAKRVFCVITAPLTGNIYTVCMMSIAVIDILIVICYIVFTRVLKKVQISESLNFQFTVF